VPIIISTQLYVHCDLRLILLLYMQRQPSKCVSYDVQNFTNGGDSFY